jgi:hypothetical protein
MIKPVNIDHKYLDQFKNFNVAQQQQQKVLVPISWDGKKKKNGGNDSSTLCSACMSDLSSKHQLLVRLAVAAQIEKKFFHVWSNI